MKWQQVAQQLSVALVAGILLIAAAAAWERVAAGGLISILGGATARELAAVKGQLMAHVEEVQVQSGVEILPFTREERPLAAQRGDSRLRGIVGRRVDFPAAFAREPVVHMALAGADARDGANLRLRVRVTSVDPEGFEYELYSWADTHLFNASASWVAVVP